MAADLLGQYRGSTVVAGWVPLGCAIPVAPSTTGATIGPDAVPTLHLPGFNESELHAPSLPCWEDKWLHSPYATPHSGWGEIALGVPMVTCLGLSMQVDLDIVRTDQRAFFRVLDTWVKRFTDWSELGTWQFSLGRGHMLRTFNMNAFPPSGAVGLDAPTNFEISFAPRVQHTVQSLEACRDLASRRAPEPVWVMAYQALERQRRGDNRGAFADGCSALEQLLSTLMQRHLQTLPPRARDHLTAQMDKKSLGYLVSTMRAMFGAPTPTLEDDRLVTARNAALHRRGTNPSDSDTKELTSTVIALCSALHPLPPSIIAPESDKDAGK